MKTLYLFLLLTFSLVSCVSKKYTQIKQLPKGIQSATEEIYILENNQKKLLQKKSMNFTKNGRIKNSITTDCLGQMIQSTQKKLWFTVQMYPDKENYYCKTRWKTNNRERISCYTRKQFKQNEAIYHYNPDGTIHKIVDHYPPFYSQYYRYTNQVLTTITVNDKNDNLIDDIIISCIKKDEKGCCIEEISTWTKTKLQQERHFLPTYD